MNEKMNKIYSEQWFYSSLTEKHWRTVHENLHGTRLLEHRQECICDCRVSYLVRKETESLRELGLPFPLLLRSTLPCNHCPIHSTHQMSRCLQSPSLPNNNLKELIN